MDRQISSVKTYSSCYVCLYTGTYYSGSKLCITGNVQNFESLGINDKVRSFKQGKIDYSRDAIFYFDSYYRGIGIVSSYDTSHARTVDNRFSSAKIPNGKYVRIYSDFYYKGYTRDLVGNVAHFGDFSMNDRVSSWLFYNFPSRYAVFF